MSKLLEKYEDAELLTYGEAKTAFDELYDALQKADEFQNEIEAIMGRIEPKLEIVDVGVILMSTQLEQANERIAELEEELASVLKAVGNARDEALAK
jgi:polyhydroxyalkanoate synthesis regulator phasin